MNGRIRKANDFITIENCKQFCYAHGYVFSGLQNSRQCFCGDTIPKQMLPIAQCDMKCTGDNTQICGGSWAMNIFDVSSEGDHVFT